jgi:plastocyanin
MSDPHPRGRPDAAGPAGRGPLLPPVAYPLLGLVFGGILVFSFSRVLLAVKKEYAPAIAMLVALNVLVGTSLVAYGRRVRRRPASFPLLLAAAAGVVAIGVLALNLQPTGVSEAAGNAKPVAITLVAKGVAFDHTTLQMPAGAKVSLSFHNEDSGIPHNFALFSDPARTQVVFRGDVITGPKTTNYPFTAPAQPGTYYFHCDVHPTQMKGTVTVTAPGGSGGGGGGAGGGAGGTTLTAQGLAFHPAQLTAKGGGQITIHFDNRDAGTPHNLAVFNGSDASSPVLFRGDLVTGPGTKDYSFTAPPPGSYFFHCDVHPQQMTGTLVVT